MNRDREDRSHEALLNAADCPLMASAWALEPRTPGPLSRLVRRLIDGLTLDGGPAAADRCCEMALASVACGHALVGWRLVRPDELPCAIDETRARIS